MLRRMQDWIAAQARRDLEPQGVREARGTTEGGGPPRGR
jgi:hypothetical protein